MGMGEAEALDELAGPLRERLLRDAGAVEGRADLHERIGELVERECGLLDAAARARLDPAGAEPSIGLVARARAAGPGGRAGSAVALRGGEAVRHATGRIGAPLGRGVDGASVLVDARLPVGSRLNVVTPPLALAGAILTIRRSPRRGASA